MTDDVSARVRFSSVDPAHRLTSLTDAARAIAGSAGLVELLEAVAHAAQTIIGTHQVAVTRLGAAGWSDATTCVSLSDAYAAYRDYDVEPQGLGLPAAVLADQVALRLDADGIAAHPAFRGLRDAPGHPPLPSYLAAPLVARDGTSIGLVQLSDRVDGSPFDEHDEATVLHLADMASAAIEHVETRVELEQTLAHFDLALDATGTGTWDWDTASGEVRWSVGLHHIYGIEPGTFTGTVEEHLARLHPDDRAAVYVGFEGRLEAGRRYDYGYRIIRPDGAVRWVAGAGLPLRDATGAVTGLTGVCVDVTDRHLADERRDHEHRLVEQLHRVAAIVTSSVDLAEILQAVTDAATALTPAQFGAFCYDAVGDDGERYQLDTLSGVDQSRFEGAAMPRTTEIFGSTPRDGRTVRLDDVTADPFTGSGPSRTETGAGHLQVRSYLAVPVQTPDGEVLGGLFFGHAEPGRFSELDARLVEGIAGYASIAVRNARLFAAVRRELEARERALADRARVAAVLQESLLPPSLPVIPGLEVAARYRSGVEEVGGDFYDVSPLAPGRWAFVLGDVCGKGPQAAAQTAFARHTVRTAAMLESRDRVLGVLNDSLWALGDAPQRMCSVVFAVASTPVDQRVAAVPVDLAVAGHPAPIVLRAGGGVEVLHAPGTLVGVVPDPTFGEASVLLEPGDALLLYTDGVTEARRGDRLFDEDGLVALLAGLAGAPAERIADAVDEAVVTFRDPRTADDVAFLVLRVPG